MRKFGVLILFGFSIISCIGFMMLIQDIDTSSIYALILIFIFAILNITIGVLLVSNAMMLSREDKLKKMLKNK